MTSGNKEMYQKSVIFKHCVKVFKFFLCFINPQLFTPLGEVFPSTVFCVRFKALFFTRVSCLILNLRISIEIKPSEVAMDDQKNYKMRIIKWWPLVFLIFSPTAIKFPCFSSNVIGLLSFFFSLAIALSQLSRSIKTLKFSRGMESRSRIITRDLEL